MALCTRLVDGVAGEAGEAGMVSLFGGGVATTVVAGRLDGLGKLWKGYWAYP